MSRRDWITVRSESPPPTRLVSELVATVMDEDPDLAELVADLAGSADTPEPTAEELAEIYRLMELSAEEVKLLLVGRT